MSTTVMTGGTSGFGAAWALGDARADLALRVTRPADRHLYAALRRGRLIWPGPSALARNDDTACRCRPTALGW